MKKWIPFLCVIGTLLVLVLITLGVYASSYQKLGTLIGFVNRNEYDSSENPDLWVSYDQEQALDVTECPAGENAYVLVHPGTRVSSLGWGRITYLCQIRTTVHDSGSRDVLGQYEGKRRVEMRFQNWEWRIDRVEIIE